MNKNLPWMSAVLVVALLGSPVTILAADSYIGAEAVLKKLSEKATAEDAPRKDLSDSAKLKRDIEAFRKQNGTMKPEEAAKGWLALLERQTKLSPESFRTSFEMNGSESEDTFNVQDIFGALPPPAAWDALRKEIEGRPVPKGAKGDREFALRLFIHTLVADRPAQSKDIADMEALFATLSENESYNLASTLDQLSLQMLEISDDPQAVMKSLERRLASMRSEGYSEELAVPNLVAMVGREKAEAFLRRALVKQNVEVSIDEGEETQKLARKLALELIDQMKSPQWGLACSLDGVALYEALEKRFTEKEEETNNAALPDVPVIHRRAPGSMYSDKGQAQAYYLLGLIVSDRTKDAVALAQQLGKNEGFSLPYEALKTLGQTGHTVAIHNFFREILLQNPDLPFWDDYIQLAAQAGETTKMLELARKAAAREDLDGKQRKIIRETFYKALLAADQTEEGIQAIRKLLADKDTKLADQYESERSERGEMALQLATLGHLLDKQELVEEGLRHLREAMALKQKREDYSSSMLIGSYASFLLKIGRGPEAESVLMNALAESLQTPSSPYARDNSTRQTYLTALVSIYHSAGRHADVIALLEQSPDWGVKDLALVHSYGIASYMTGKGTQDTSLNYLAASSLLALDRKAEARKIVDALLDQRSGLDPGYELLLKLENPDAVLKRLDAIFALDQFEERPLIWKAVVLKEAGKLEEAEAVVRRAISIDPSDGEQGPDRRMKAYAVLAEIREARGDKKEADFFREVVKAIRLSEKADRYNEAGLLKQAVKMYEESLTHFADAYCIQSRLALQMSQMGMHEAAEEHYRRAYELMPDSFGRVESHCFGCERAFDGTKMQSIAEKVFTTLAKKTPEKPQVHYLLGYLREEQQRYSEALTHYREAVRLDPDYLNAWKHLQTVGHQAHLPAADKDAMTFNLLRLDPLNRHGSSHHFRNVTDLRALWSAVETASKLSPPKHDVIFPLPASTAQLEKEAKEKKNSRNDYYGSHSYYGMIRRTDDWLQPGKVVVQNGIIASVMSMISRQSGLDD